MSATTMTLQEAAEFFGESLMDFGLDTFPTPEGFNPEDFRERLGRKLINHYWNREIGLESFSMWRFNMRRAMNEIMPYFCKLYESELIKFDPLSTLNMKSTSSNTQEADSTGKQSSKGDSTNRSKVIASDYPQTAMGQNRTGNFATTGQDSLTNAENTGSADESRNEKGSSSSESTSTGYAGSAAALLTEFRSTLLNVDMLVIEDGKIEELFLGVLSTPNTWTGTGYSNYYGGY